MPPPLVFAILTPVPHDGYYLSSWKITLVCIILFAGICNVSAIVLRYRLKLPDCSNMAINQIKWTRKLRPFAFHCSAH